MRADSAPAVVYVLRCRDGSLYTGWTGDLARRVRAHATGRGGKYTRSRLHVTLLAWWDEPDVSAARRAEVRFKRLSRRGKLAALAASQAFGSPVRKPPGLLDTPTYERSAMTIHTAPTGDDLAAYAEKARTSAVRIATPKGDIVFTFFADDAPRHCAAFVKLAEAGFYDGLTFHRVEPGFVVQGGDPSGNGTGGPGYRLAAEFNDRPHLRGTVAMARSSDPHSAGSQFYICLGDARFLDKQYTVFGGMTDGFDALDAIRAGDTMTRVSVEPASGAR